MLYTPVNQFNWEANNFSSLWPSNSAATLLTADGSANTKGTSTALLTGIAEDCYEIELMFSNGDTNNTIRRQMTDLMIDPAAGVGGAGSSWSVAINNLYSNSPSTAPGSMGYCYHFPLYLKAGTAIGARVQDVVGAATVRLSIRVLGKPTRPELLKVGTKVQTLGATTASTTGVAVTPGTAAVGSYSASLGTLTNDAWWWQVGIGSNDSGMTVCRYWFDIAHDATNKYICARGISYGVSSTTEQSWKGAFGESQTICVAPAGTDVYVRGTGNTTPDSSMTAIVYAVS